MEQEQWLPVVGYEGYYEVSNLGKTRNISRLVKSGFGSSRIIRERILKSSSTKDGYLSIGLCVEGKLKTFRVHRVVGQAWIPNPENKPYINHIDFDPTNNAICNLEWCTQKENMEHSAIHNRMFSPAAEDNHFSKLTWEDVREIRRLISVKSMRFCDIGSLFGVCKSTISLINTGKIWLTKK